MTLRALALWTLLVFVSGWIAGQWFATLTADDAQAHATGAVASAQDTTAAPIAGAPPAPVAPTPARMPPASSDAGTSGTDAPAPGPNRTGLDQTVMDAVLKMAERGRMQETIDYQAQIRSEPWASEHEVKIRAAIDRELSMVAGARLVRAECRTTLCQADIMVPAWASEMISQNDGAGTLHTALGGAGLGVQMISTTDAAEPGIKRLLYTMRPDEPVATPPVADRH